MIGLQSKVEDAGIVIWRHDNRPRHTMLSALTILAMLLMCALGMPAQAETAETDPGRLFPGTSMQFLNAHVEDTLSDVQQKAAGHWKALGKKSVTLNYRNEPVWFRLALPPFDTASSWYFDVDWPLLDHVDVWLLDRHGKTLKHYKTGDHLPFAQRPMPLPNFVFPLDQPDAAELYLRVETSSLFYFTPTLWRETEITDGHRYLLTTEGRNKLWQGIFVGVMLGMILYNLFVYRTTGDRAYLAYVGYCVVIMLFECEVMGLNYQYLWPESPIINDHAFNVFAGLSYFFVTIFFTLFLDLHKHPRLEKLLHFFSAMWLLISASALYQDERTFTSATALLSGISVLTALTVPIYVWRQGNVYGLIFLLAWCLLISGTILAVLSEQGWLEANWLTMFGGQGLGVMLETIIISLGLSYRLKTMRALAHKAREEAIFRAANHASLLEANIEERMQEIARAQNEAETVRDQARKSEKNSAITLLLNAVANEMERPNNQLIGGISTSQEESISLTHYVNDLLTDNNDIELQGLLLGSLKDLAESLDNVLTGYGRIFDLKEKLSAEHYFMGTRRDAFSVTECVDQACQRIRDEFESVRFKWDIPSSYYCAGWPGALEEAIYQVLRNAAQACTKNRGDTGLIKIRISHAEQFCHIAIDDNGGGIPPEVITRIFDPFFTTRDIGDGQGLGLTLAQEIILRMNGCIDAASRADEGTQIVMRIPS